MDESQCGQLVLQRFRGRREFFQLQPLIAVVGGVHPRRLTASHILAVEEAIEDRSWAQVTQYAARYRTREALKYLADFHRAPRLAHHIKPVPRPRPRNVTATADEIRDVIEATASNRGLKLLVLLCSDLAIRSGTACRLSWAHFHPEWQSLIFSTKWQEKLTLPVTAEVEELLRQTDPRDKRPFVTQL